MQIIARIHTDFPTKFGVPRQSGLASALESTIVFEPEFRNPDALRGIEDFSHIWLIWQFDRALLLEAHDDNSLCGAPRHADVLHRCADQDTRLRHQQ